MSTYGNRADSFSKTDLSDGFREVFDFPGHKMTVRGMTCMEVIEEKEFCADRRDTYLSWDLMNAYLWVREHQSSHPPKILYTLKFPPGSKGFITSIVYVPKLKIYLASALDMSFKLHDKHLVLIESIRHEERSLGCLQYDSERDIIIAASATGVSLWRIFRNSSSSKEYSLERCYVYQDPYVWITKIEIDKALGVIYAFAETSCFVLSIDKRRIVHRLERIHEANLTAITWYARSQFYLTACNGGMIKCWTSLSYEKRLARSAVPHTGQCPDPLNTVSGKAHNAHPHFSHDTENVDFSCLHTFRLHSDAVTGVVLHPISGMAISASLDGFIRLLNLENFTEIYNINMNKVGITALKIFDYAPAGKKAIMFADIHNHIRVWRISSTTGFPFFGIMNSNVVSMNKFESMHESFINEFYSGSDPILRMRRMTEVHGKVAESTVYSDTSTFGKRDSDDEESDKEKEEEDNEALIMEAFMNHSSHSIRSKRKKSTTVDAAIGATLKAAQTEKLAAATLKAITDQENERSRAFLSSSYVGSLAAGPQDLRIFSGAPKSGQAISVLEPEVTVDGIICYTVSVYQHLLFCLFESGRLKVFCCRSADAPLLLNVDLTVGQMEHESGLCATIIDCIPDNAARPSGKANAEYLSDIRGNQIPHYITEVLVVGSKSGSLLFFDTLHHCDFCFSLPSAQQIPVSDLQYRHRNKELFTVGKSGSGSRGHTIVVRVFSVPSMECILEVADLRHVTVFTISQILPNFGVGCADGEVRIFKVSLLRSGEKGSPTKRSRDRHVSIEMMREGSTEVDRAHRAPITGLAFSDELQIYASCSADQVIIIWTLGKQYIRSLSYNMPLTCLIFNGAPGDLVFSQNNYLLTVPKAIWNTGGAMEAVIEASERDPWAAGSLGLRGATENDSDAQIAPAMLNSTKPEFTGTHNAASRTEGVIHDPAATFSAESIMVSDQLDRTQSRTTSTIGLPTTLRANYTGAWKSTAVGEVSALLESARFDHSDEDSVEVRRPINTRCPRFMVEKKPSVLPAVNSDIPAFPATLNRSRGKQQFHPSSSSSMNFICQLTAGVRASSVLLAANEDRKVTKMQGGRQEAVSKFAALVPSSYAVQRQAYQQSIWRGTAKLPLDLDVLQAEAQAAVSSERPDRSLSRKLLSISRLNRKLSVGSKDAAAYDSDSRSTVSTPTAGSAADLIPHPPDTTAPSSRPNTRGGTPNTVHFADHPL